jgi:4-diphosphocytidyl-2-C-methyl-D-erythritol kinase
MQVRSFAKINLGLEVLRKRPDGYHEIRTLFQSINFHDILSFRALRENRIELTGTDMRISWGKDNIVYKAACLLAQRHARDQGAVIHVIKNIPPGTGLGGGSSNAAMTLWALNQLWGLELDRGSLMSLAAELGSDIPYFLQGGLCLGTGRGEKIQPLKDLKNQVGLLILPRLSVSTALVYGHHRASLTSHSKDSKIRQFLKSSQLHGLDNDLEETVFSFYPLIKESKRDLRSLKPELSMLSGSGSAVFGLFQNLAETQRARQVLQGVYRVHMIETLSRDQYWKSVSAGV